MPPNTLLLSLAAAALFTTHLHAKTPAKPHSKAVALLPDTLRWDSASFFSRTVVGVVQDGKTVKAPVFEKIRFDEVGLGQKAAKPKPSIPSQKIDEETSLGLSILRLVEDSLAQAFGKQGDKPNFEYLSKVFQGKQKNILKGRAIQGKEEKVQYYWTSADEWVTSLKEMVGAGKRFQVSLAIIWMYQDLNSPNRFWAVVKQQWETVDANGSTLYRDDGFLFLNFDLDELKKPRNLRVNYRLWFYNYKQTDVKTGLKPHERLAQDIRGALDPQNPVEIQFGRLVGDRWVADPAQRGLSGIDRDLVNRMGEDLVGGIRAARGL